jgi:hypothetical protein
MATNPTKGVHPFILTILSIMEGNLDFERAVYSDPMYADVFVYGNMHYVPNVVRMMYVSAQGGEPTLAELVGPIMVNPAFIIQIIAQTGGDKEMGHGGKGNIWQWAGIAPHADFNGQVRPIIDVSLDDLRKVVQRPTITWQ